MHVLYRPALLATAILFAVAGCSSVRETSPTRTATEQLLISTATDAAVAKMSLPIDKGAKVFVDATNFEGIDAKYAIAAIRELFLKQGARLAAERAGADVVVEIRAAALSTDENQFLIGIPQYDIPVPLAGPLKTPEIALFKREEKRGVAKFIATAYKAETGDYIGSTEPEYGFSYKREWSVLIFFSWSRDNLLPDEYRPEQLQMQPPRF